MSFVSGTLHYFFVKTFTKYFRILFTTKKKINYKIYVVDEMKATPGTFDGAIQVRYSL